ncbi:conserved protein, unknown function [Hepatocystis sp. ex Piliocolobus tephrosceles]|nr:conserved protein, unknown function [Hepatocystis sp. ex Piliocolobus tephrosceles]
MKEKKEDYKNKERYELKDIKNILEGLKNETETKNIKTRNVKTSTVKKNVDAFDDLKAHILNILEETRKYIRSKESIQKIHGNNVEAIKYGNIIYNNMKKLDVYFNKLNEILTKQSKQTYIFSREAINDKYECYELLKKQIYECKKLGNYDNIKNAYMMDFGEFKNKPILDRKNTETNKHEEDDLIIINKWKERDKKFNDDILQIGEVVDRIGENAILITRKAEEQNELILNVQETTEKTQDNVKEINLEIKKVMKKHSQVTWCCRISLAVILLMLVLTTISILLNRIKNL